MPLTNTASRLLENDFGVVTGARSPRRLSASTREFAARALSGQFGAQLASAPFRVDETTHPGTTALHQCALAVCKIADLAPVRLLDDRELIVGAATLIEATHHNVPGTHPLRGISHTTLGFDRVLREGYAGIRRRLERRLGRGDLLGQQRELLEYMRMCLDAAGRWHARYVQAVQERMDAGNEEDRRHWCTVLENLRPVPENPPESFRQAVQALWMSWSFLRLCGNWSGLGRIDRMLGPYLERDLRAGRITRDRARELIAHFWIKGCEWIGADTPHSGTSGDAQFYQNVVLAGVDVDGREVANEVTHLVLDVVEELHISDYPVAVRINPNTPERLLRRIARIQQRGGGIVSVYNEPTVLGALERFGYDHREARRFANDGCWEVIIPGKTAFAYRPFDTLRLLQNALGLGPDAEHAVEYQTFEDLYAAFMARLREHLRRDYERTRDARSGEEHAPLVCLFADDCIERARGYNQRGPAYTVVAPHAGGIPDTANSLHVIKTLVYEEGRVTLAEMLQAIRDDWQGHDRLLSAVQRRCRLYGNDRPGADGMVERIFDDFTRLARELADHEQSGVLRPAGISTFGRELAYREHRLATAFGRRRGDILATNLAPTPGTDEEGPTAVMRSFCRMDFEALPNGTPLELKLLPGSFQGTAGEDMIVSLMRTFMDLGGIYLHVDVVDTQVLKEAQRHPESFPNLVVRISGWSARFATLSKDWQDMIIQRTQQA